jgi:hypothetical protein
MPNRWMGYTPFILIYGAEAIMPTNIDHDSPHVVNYSEEENELARQDGVDLLDEDRELVLSKTSIYQQGLQRYHSRRVRTRGRRPHPSANPGQKGHAQALAPWEGPFAINRMLGNDVYYLPDVQKDNDGNPLTREVERPWNVNLLRRFYT